MSNAEYILRYCEAYNLRIIDFKFIDINDIND